MKTPIAIIHWERDAKIVAVPTPRVEHVFTLADLDPRNFFAIKSAEIIPFANADCAALASACAELQRTTGAERITLHSVADAWSAQTWQPA